MKCFYFSVALTYNQFLQIKVFCISEMILDILVTADYCSKKLTSFTEALSKVLQNKDVALDAYNRKAWKKTLDHWIQLPHIQERQLQPRN